MRFQFCSNENVVWCMWCWDAKETLQSCQQQPTTNSSGEYIQEGRRGSVDTCGVAKLVQVIRTILNELMDFLDLDVVVVVELEFWVLSMAWCYVMLHIVTYGTIVTYNALYISFWHRPMAHAFLSGSPFFFLGFARSFSCTCVKNYFALFVSNLPNANAFRLLPAERILSHHIIAVNTTEHNKPSSVDTST